MDDESLYPPCVNISEQQSMCRALTESLSKLNAFRSIEVSFTFPFLILNFALGILCSTKDLSASGKPL